MTHRFLSNLPTAIFIFLISGSANAALIEGDHDGFQLDFLPKDATLCATGRGTGKTATQCTSAELAELKSFFPKAESLQCVARVTFGESRYFLTYDISELGRNFVDEAEADRFARSTLKQIQDRSAARGRTVEAVNPSWPGKLTKFGGATAIFSAFRTRFSTSPDETPVKTLSYTIIGHTVAHTVQIIVAEPLADHVRNEFEVALTDLKVDVVDSSDHETTKFARLFGFLLAALTIILVFKSRGLKRRWY